MRTRMLVGALIAAAMVPGSAAAALPDPLSEPAAFKAPPGSVAPGMRWWWGPISVRPPGALSQAETRKEVGYMADAGFKRIEIAFSNAKWATAEQRENLEAALDEASKRG